MVSPLFQVFSILRLLSKPFNFAHTLAAARAVLFSPNSITVYKLPSNLMIMPRLISEVFAINDKNFKSQKTGTILKRGGKIMAKLAGGKMRCLLFLCRGGRFGLRGFLSLRFNLGLDGCFCF